MADGIPAIGVIRQTAGAEAARLSAGCLFLRAESSSPTTSPTETLLAAAFWAPGCLLTPAAAQGQHSTDETPALSASSDLSDCPF